MPNASLRLKHAFIAEAEITIVSDHDMIEHANTDDFANFLQTFGEVDVFGARRRIAARVIMDENHGSGGLSNYWIKNFARMD
jgi:hypothetical protein